MFLPTVFYKWRWSPPCIKCYDLCYARLMQFELPENLNLKIRDGDALLSLDSSKNGMVCLCQRPLINGDGRHPVSNATISAHQCIKNQMRPRPGSRPLFLASWQRLSGRQTCTLFLAIFRSIHTYIHSHVHTHRHSCMRRANGPDLNAFALYVPACDGQSGQI